MTSSDPSPRLDVIAASWVARRDAGLNATESRELAAWLAADPRHRQAFAEQRFAWSLLDRPVRQGAADDVLAELQRLAQLRRRRGIVATTTLALALAAGLVSWRATGDRFGSGREVAAMTSRVVLPARQTLPDGTVVDLKDGARIAAHFSAAERRVVLEHGEAHFQVTKDPARPFVVAAHGIEVRAVGTAFTVQLGQTAIDVVVTEGHVAIDPRAEAAAGRPAQAILAPSQQAVIEPGSIAARVRSLTADELSERLAWRAPRLELTGTPLTEVVARLNDYAVLRHDVRLSIGDPAIAGVRVSGLFRVDNTAALLDLLDSAFGIAADPDRTTEIVLRKAER